jgi:DNA polymerase alpha subunit A
MYGCLGFKSSRFYALGLASLITTKGREILLSSKDLVQGLNFDVIYGDTDSLMIDSKTTDVKEVKEISSRIIKNINKKYKRLEIG